MNDSEEMNVPTPSAPPEYSEIEKLLHCQQNTNRLLFKVNEKLVWVLLCSIFSTVGIGLLVLSIG